MTRLLFSERKEIRAQIIREYMREAGYRACVCFSCGNAATELARLVHTVRVCPNGDLRAERWWSVAEVRRVFPDLFDATSGHLSAALMVQLARVVRCRLRVEEREYEVPTGSGETISVLRIAFPRSKFYPVYNVGVGTEYHAESALNELVQSYETI